jgi:hypothetical protein
MSKVTFVLQLDRTGTPGTAARLWLDASRDGVLQPGEEVTLATVDGKLWIARKDVPPPTAGMQFLLKFIAPIGAKWSFVATADDAELYAVKDQATTTTQEILAGRLA